MGFDVPTRMVRTRHPFAPAVTFEQAINGGRTRLVPDLLLIGILDVLDADKLSRAGLMDKTLEKGRFLPTRHILVQPSTTWLKIQSFKPVTKPSHMYPADCAPRYAGGIGNCSLRHPVRCPQMHDLDASILGFIALGLL